MKINIITIPRSAMRYPTSGDYWQERNGDIEVRIEDKGSFRDEMLILIHELVELYLTKLHAVPWKDIDEFDRTLDKTHPELEPGDQNNAPYYKEHQAATLVEKLLTLLL